MNDITAVKPGLVEAYRDKSSNLYVRERRDSEGRYSYKVSTVESWWSYIKQFFRSLFTCCSSTPTTYTYGLDAYNIIAADQDLQKKINTSPISTLVTTKGQKSRFEAVIQTSRWRLTTKAIESLIFNGLVSDVFPRIFSNLDFRALQASCCVSKACHRLAFEQNEQTRQKVEGTAFGKVEWKALGLDIGDEPLIPPSLVNSLDEPDPVDPNQTIGDTHMLALVPAGLTLKSLGALVKSRSPGSQASGYRYIWNEILNQLSIPNEKSYWVLMKKDVIPGSRDQSFATQKEMVTTFAEDANADYVIPTALEAAVCILTYEVRLGERRERLFGDNPWTYTRCQEEIDGWQVCVGGFAPAGLRVFLNSDDDDVGVAVLRKS